MGSRAKAASTASFMILPFQYSQISQKGIGLVVPFDFALDDECWRWLPAGASLYIMRTLRPGETAVTAKLAKEVSSSEAVVPRGTIVIICTANGCCLWLYLRKFYRWYSGRGITV